MNKISTYLGAIVLLIGVLVLAIPEFTSTTSNFSLFLGLILVIVGYLAHIFFVRKSKVED